MENNEKSKKKLQEAINKPRKSRAGKKGAGLRQRPAKEVSGSADSEMSARPNNIITGLDFVNSVSATCKHGNVNKPVNSDDRIPYREHLAHKTAYAGPTIQESTTQSDTPIVNVQAVSPDSKTAKLEKVVIPEKSDGCVNHENSSEPEGAEVSSSTKVIDRAGEAVLESDDANKKS